MTLEVLAGGHAVGDGADARLPLLEQVEGLVHGGREVGRRIQGAQLAICASLALRPAARKAETWRWCSRRWAR